MLSISLLIWKNLKEDIIIIEIFHTGNSFFLEIKNYSREKNLAYLFPAKKESQIKIISVFVMLLKVFILPKM